MELTQTSVSQQDGILTISCVGILDEITSPPVFGSIVKYAKEAPQVVLLDFTHVLGIKTAFINGIIEVIKFIKASSGAVVAIPGPMADILEITGVKAMVQIVASVDEGKTYARTHFPHILDFILSQKEKNNVTQATSNQTVDLKNWAFFSDTEKKKIDIEKVLKYSILVKASDVHLAANKPITFRVEGVLIKIEQEPVLSNEHMDQVKEQLLEKHPEILERLNKMHDADF